MYRVIIPTATVIAGLIFVHGLIPEHFVVDNTTIGLILLLAAVLAIPYLPSIRRYISELNVLGSGVKFREEVDTAAEEVEAIAAKVREETSHHPQVGEAQPPLKRGYPWPVFVEIGEHLYRLIEEDPKLAVVGLGIEVERAIQDIMRGTGLDGRQTTLAPRAAISKLRQANRIDAEEEALLLRLLQLRALALHGGRIDKEDAQKFFSVVESLNDFATGYSLNLTPNERWEEQGLVCQYEHCIERMPLKRERWEGSCPVFGHDCPGGVPQVETCKSEGRSAAHPWGTRQPARRIDAR